MATSPPPSLQPSSSLHNLSYYLGGGRASPTRGGSPPTSPAAAADGRSTNSMSAKARWHDVLKKVKMQMAHMGRVPMVPVSKIEELKTLFTDARTGKLLELDHDSFCDGMCEALKGRNFTQDELSTWFADMDVDLSNSVSWEEFTSFMISAATSFGEENVRAKEFLPDLIANTPTAVMHKDSVKRLVTSRTCPYIVSGGYDGLVKLWRPRDGAHMYSINNNVYSAAHEAIPAGSVVPISPIMDIAFNSRGTHCFVAAADKSVNIYDAKTFALTRKFVGTVADTLDAAYWKPNMLGCDGVPDVNSRRFAAAASGITTSFRTVESAEASLLLSMTEAPSSLDIATPHENEVLFFATHDGSILAYPSLRHSVLPDIPKLAHYRDIHNEPISKMRFEPSLKALITASWDASICLTNPDTGQLIHRLPGHNQQAVDFGSDVLDTVDIGHRKIALDFAFSPSHHLLATVGADRAIMLWNPLFSLPVSSLRGHTAPLCSVAMDEIDNLLISMDNSGVVKTWDMRMNRCLQTIGGQGSGEGGGGGGPPQASATSASVECKLDVPTAMIYAPEYHRIICAGRSVTSYTVRRAQTHFHPTHIGHCEGIISYASFPDTSSIVTADANVFMRWNVRNGRRQSLWDVNPPSADGGDMLTRTNDASASSSTLSYHHQQQQQQQPRHPQGGAPSAAGAPRQGADDGSSAAAAPSGSAMRVSSIACFDRDASQRRIFAVTMDGALISFNPSNGQQLRRMELAAFLTDEPFRVVHLCNAHNTVRVIAVVTAREAIFVSEDIDEVTGLMPFGAFGRVVAPTSTSITTTTTTTTDEPKSKPTGGGGQQCFFSAVSIYPPGGSSTLPSLVLGTTEGHLQVYFPLSQECGTSVMHPPRRSSTRQSSHRRQRRGSSSVDDHRRMSEASASLVATTASSVEDIVYIRSLDLFVTCVGDNHMFLWDLRNGLLKLQFCTMLQPEECILSLASGEDSEPFVSYDTALSKKGAAAAAAAGGGGAGGNMVDGRGGGASTSLKSMIRKRANHGGLLGVSGSIKSISQLLREALMVRDDGTLGLVVDTDGVGEASSGYITDNLLDDEERRLHAIRMKQTKEHTRDHAAYDGRHRILISGCDWGFVYVWDVSGLPCSTAPASAFVKRDAPMTLLSVFRAHNAPITRLSYFESERMICSMSTVDCYVKTFHLRGSYVGHFGQRTPYWFRDATTFAADPFSVAVEDSSQKTPRCAVPTPTPPPPPPQKVAGGDSMHSVRGGGGGSQPHGHAGFSQSPIPSNAHHTIIRDTPNVPCTPAAAAGGGGASRPSTRQLDSPASSVFASSFFATSVPNVRRGVIDRHHVESPREVDMFAAIPVVGTFEGGSPLGGAPAAAARHGSSSMRGGLDSPSRSPRSEDEGVPTKWTSPFAVLSQDDRRAAQRLARAAPCGLPVRDGIANLRPLLYKKKRLSIRATNTETMDEVRRRKPRHMASVVGNMFRQSNDGHNDDDDDEIVPHNLHERVRNDDNQQRRPGDDGPAGAPRAALRRRSFGRVGTPLSDHKVVGDDRMANPNNLAGGEPGTARLRRSSRGASPTHHQVDVLATPVFLLDAPANALASRGHTPAESTVTPPDVSGPFSQSLLVPPPALRSLLRTPTPEEGLVSSSPSTPSMHRRSPRLPSPILPPHVAATSGARSTPLKQDRSAKQHRPPLAPLVASPRSGPPATPQPLRFGEGVVDEEKQFGSCQSGALLPALKQRDDDDDVLVAPPGGAHHQSSSSTANGSFLLTAMDYEFEHRRGIEAGEAGAMLVTRSHSVPLLRRFGQQVPPVLTRSSEKYRARSSLSMLPSSPGRQSLPFPGSPAPSQASFDAPPSMRHPSPSSSPRSHHQSVIGGFERSAIHKSTSLLHHTATHGRTETENRVDRVTRLIRDRELLKHHPVLIRSSLLEENASMRQEVEVMPSAWTTRASSLLRTHDFELRDIQKRFWSPKQKEVSKSKLLKWNTGSSLFGADPRMQAQLQQKQQQQQGMADVASTAI